jgi:hypothetical protein
MSARNLKARRVLARCVCVVALALLAPLSANAQVTVTAVRVTISNSAKSVTYCDTTTGGCSLSVWDLAGGVALAPGQTLVLTQTALIPGIGPNFDTSDLVSLAGTSHCNVATPCTVTVELNTGSGLAVVYGPSAVGTPLTDFNADPGGGDHQEAAAYVQVAAAAKFTLSFGYADNEHTNGGIPPPGGCLIPGCFPTPFFGATHFIGAGVGTEGSCETNCFDAGAILITARTPAPPPPPIVEGRMTGGGSVFTTDDVRVTHGFELHCDPLNTPNNLEINWGGGNNFHLTSLLTVTCVNDPNIEPQPPNAGFDTYIGTGVGTCNGLPALISFTLTDAGEPGTLDTASYTITGACSLTVSGNLDKGNQQAHKK